LKTMSRVPISATGFWTAVYFGGAAKFCAAIKGEDILLEEDRNILRPLAGKIRRLSEHSREREKRQLWYGIPAARTKGKWPDRPHVMRLVILSLDGLIIYNVVDYWRADRNLCS